jgi:predicted RNA-binding Zn-ribbon protein involved in translation (DUF1610 family)
VKKLNLDEVLEAAENDTNTGFCIECGAEVSNVEPDARKYPCEECGENKVYGAEEIILMFGFDF